MNEPHAEEYPLPPIDGHGEHATVKFSDYILAIRQGDLSVQRERDRRYAEVALEKEKALKVREEADNKALDLARQIQTYKDEKANQLRDSRLAVTRRIICY